MFSSLTLTLEIRQREKAPKDWRDGKGVVVSFRLKYELKCSTNSKKYPVVTGSNFFIDNRAAPLNPT